MTLDQYQAAAGKTAVYPNVGRNLNYAVLGLCGESGEVANKVKKVQRDHGGQMTAEARLALIKELGDALWYLATACTELAVSLDTVAQANLDNLARRQQTGTLHGSGDDR